MLFPRSWFALKKGGVKVGSWLWWTGYTLCAVWAQEWIAGIDFFSPGVILCLQAGQWRKALWLGIAWGILQEGTGALVFGAMLLFEVGLFCFFFWSKWLLEPENPLFVLLLSVFLVAWHEVIFVGLGSLQGLVVTWNPFPVLFLQLFAYVLTWAFVYPLFIRMVPRVAD